MKRGTRTEPGTRDPTDIVAAQIDQHDMLGSLLLIVDQLFRQRGIGFRRCPAWTRARNRMVGDHPVFDSHQQLRRRADDLVVIEIEIEHVRRRIHRPQRPVDRERMHRCVDIDSLREHDLEDVAGRDVLPRRFDELVVSLDGGIRLHALVERGRDRIGTSRHLPQRRPQPADHLLDALFGLRIGFRDRPIVCQIEMTDDLDSPLEVVEHDHAIDHQKTPGRESPAWSLRLPAPAARMRELPRRTGTQPRHPGIAAAAGHPSALSRTRPAQSSERSTDRYSAPCGSHQRKRWSLPLRPA